MNDGIFQSFLEGQFERGLALSRGSDRVEVEGIHGDPPWCYAARFNCHGLVRNPQGGIEGHERWAIGIRFPENYLRARIHAAEVLTLLGPANIWHPNFRAPFVCVDVRPGTPLVELIYTLHDLLTWNVYGVSDDGLNPAAAQWARHQGPDRFPLDRRPLLRPGASPIKP